MNENKIGEFDVVEAVQDVPGTPVKAGMVGTVTSDFGGGVLYVEFLRPDGYTLYEDSMNADAVRLVTSYAATREKYAGDLVAA